MAQTTTDTAASTVSGAGAASSFSGGTGTEAEFGSLGALSPTWWEPEDGSEPEPWLTPDQAFERFFEWTSDRGIELWDHQEEALMDLAAGDHVILGTPTGSGKSLVHSKKRSKAWSGVSHGSGSLPSSGSHQVGEIGRASCRERV